MKPKDVVTTVRMDRETWCLLRDLAELQARRHGGSPSQSAVVRELVRAAGVLEADELRVVQERADS